jgi:hypothetical protein
MFCSHLAMRTAWRSHAKRHWNRDIDVRPEVRRQHGATALHFESFDQVTHVGVGITIMPVETTIHDA